jgi:hypothetical protein
LYFACQVLLADTNTSRFDTNSFNFIVIYSGGNVQPDGLIILGLLPWKLRILTIFSHVNFPSQVMTIKFWSGEMAALTGQPAIGHLLPVWDVTDVGSFSGGIRFANGLPAVVGDVGAFSVGQGMFPLRDAAEFNDDGTENQVGNCIRYRGQ